MPTDRGAHTSTKSRFTQRSESKKKIITCFGKLEIKKGHLLEKGTNKYGITMNLQEVLCDLAQSKIFKQVSSTLKKLLSVNISVPQVQRVSEYYGDQLNPIIEANQEGYIPQLPAVNDPTIITYTMIDGHMLCTREYEDENNKQQWKEKWKEMKVGMQFREKSIMQVSKSRREIFNPVFACHLGSVQGFYPKFERHLSKGDSKVFLCDGAKWIWSWVESNFPGSIQIVDYYHAAEKIKIFAKYHFKDQEINQKWIQEQEGLLLDNQVLQVVENLQKLKPRNTFAAEAKNVAINYYVEHEDRMQYKTFRDQGLLIGSGPVEAAHRKLIQQRMKLSGQKWSVKGAQAIGNLRCFKESNNWEMVENLIRLAA
jgi:hypothetical protein